MGCQSVCYPAIALLASGFGSSFLFGHSHFLSTKRVLRADALKWPANRMVSHESEGPYELDDQSRTQTSRRLALLRAS
jgi:hypothetical protein